MDAPSRKAPPSAIEATWLAALRFDDAGLSAVEAHLPRTWLDAAHALRADVSRMDAGDKARRMRRVVDAMRGALPETPPLPPRALGLMCAEVGRETGRRWAAASPAPRRGFVASAELRRWLTRLAGAAQDDAP